MDGSVSALLLLFQQEEVSDELLTFHEAVNHMQELEEQVVDSHRSLLEVSPESNHPLDLPAGCRLLRRIRKNMLKYAVHTWGIV